VAEHAVLNPPTLIDTYWEGNTVSAYNINNTPTEGIISQSAHRAGKL